MSLAEYPNTFGDVPPPPGRSDLGAFLSRQAPPGVVGLAFSLRVYNPPKLPRSTLLNRSLPHPQRDGVTQSFKGLSGRFIVGGAHPTSGKTNKGNRSGSRLLAVTCQVPLRPRLTSAPPPQSATQKMATDRMLPFYAQDATGAASSSTFSCACVRCATHPPVEPASQSGRFFHSHSQIWPKHATKH